MAAESLIASFSAGGWGIGAWQPVGEPGWYVHKGRVFIQGAVDIAPVEGTDLTPGEIAAIESGEAGGGEDIVINDPLLSVPAIYAPAHAIEIALHPDPYWTTPSYHKTAARTLLFPSGDPNKDYWLWKVDGLNVPSGSYGEYRLIISCWWDTPSAFRPGEGPDDPFNASGDFSDVSEGPGGKSPPPGIANKGSRVMLGGKLECESLPSPEELEPPELGHLLHNSSPAGPHSTMRQITQPPPGYPVNRSPEYPDDIGYTMGVADQGPAIIKVDRRLDTLETGVFPTDRYTFYDVRPVPGHSRPQLGQWLPHGGMSEQDQLRNGAVMSGPSTGTGMSLFIGDITHLPTTRGEPVSICLCLPQGGGGPGRGYYRLDFEDLLDSIWEPESITVGFGDEERTIVKEPVDSNWEADHVVHETRYQGPKVTFHTVNWIAPADMDVAGISAGTEVETPPYFVETDVTGQGKYFMFGRGWGFWPIPDGPKSLLITVADDDQDAKDLEQLTGEAGKLTKRPEDAPIILIEWGEVGKLPSESKERGAVMFWDPTRNLPQQRRPDPPVSDAAEKFAEPVQNYYPERVNLGMFTFLYFPWRFAGFLGEFLFELDLESKIRVVDELTQELLEWSAKLSYDRANTLPSGYIPPVGDAAITVGGEIAPGVPIWVGSYPLPPWIVMNEGEQLDMNGAGYAGFGQVGSITIGPGTVGVVPKS